jgi:fatty aldehyde-generating acyl-ACP reductase
MSHKFAFLMHPRHTVAMDMGILFGAPLSLIPDRVWATAFDRLPLPPVATGRIHFPQAPQKVAGYLIAVPFTAVQMLNLPRSRVQAKLELAVDKARDLGARIVGLGALTASVSAGGKTLSRRDDIGITNGNAFTAAMTLSGIERLLRLLPDDPLIALVGATGSVGSCLTRLLARRYSGRLLLVARNRGRLDALAGETRRDDLAVEVSSDMGDVRRADLVVLLTSSSDSLLRSEHLKSGAVVLDDTVPRNTDPTLLTARPDVLIVDGGLVDVSGTTLRGGGIGLPRGLAYACLAETMLLALDEHEGHFAIGAATVDQAERMVALADRWSELGFTLAPFRSFGRTIDPAALAGRWQPREVIEWAA